MTNRIGQSVGYIRVSTSDQNTDRQLESIELDRKFIDKCSGKDTNRPELIELIKYVRDGDIVYVHSMDRLARNLDDLRKLVNQFAAKKVKVSFVKEGLSFNGADNPMAEFMLNVMGAFAQFERELINERIREGVQIAKKAGKYKGRKKSLSDEQAAEIKRLVSERYRITDIAKQFNTSRETIYRYIRNT